MKRVDVREATHVRLADGSTEKIASTWGIQDGRLAPPSKGGFGVVTETGKRIEMWTADSYWRDET